MIREPVKSVDNKETKFGEERVVKKHIFTLALAFMMCLPLASAVPSYGDAFNTSSGTAVAPTTATVLVNDESVAFDAYNINGNNYFKLRDIAYALNGTSGQFAVGYDGATHVITLTSGKRYTPIGGEMAWNRGSAEKSPVPSALRISLDGNALELTAFNIDGNNYCKLADLGAALGFDVSWEQATRTIRIDTNDGSATVRASFNDNNAASYTFPRWSEPVYSYVAVGSDNTVTVAAIEFGDEHVVVATYDAEGALQSAKELPPELPKFGTFLSGSTYNYIAYGQDNPHESDTLEVIRIVKYDKDWNRISAASVRDCFTIEPFDNACQMAESDNILALHTARTRYLTEDGKNHQSQLTVFVDTSTMRVTNAGDLGRFQSNHVSHSFNQRVLFDGRKAVLLDHGDAYPRSVVLHKQGNGLADFNESDLFSIPGAVGANCTGVTVDGFEMSSANYIAAITTIDHSKAKNYTSFEITGLTLDQRDILLLTAPRGNAGNNTVNQIVLAKYTGTDKIASSPKLVKLSDDKFAVLWQEFTLDHTRGSLKYVFVDGSGQKIGAVQSADAVLSEVQPIVSGSDILWYTNEKRLRTFYRIAI
jgi:hypothetical protein